MKIASDRGFRLGDNVNGLYMKYRIEYDPDSREITHFKGVIVHDFDDSSYLVEIENGDRILIELYDEDTMELDETL